MSMQFDENSEDDTIERVAVELAYQALEKGRTGLLKSYSIDGFDAVTIIIQPGILPKAVYVSLGPPGVKCECCGGSGKQKRM